MATIQREEKTISTMIHIYCRKVHKQRTLCNRCHVLLAYARERLKRCPHLDKKPPCSHCAIHCYAPEMRKFIIEVMRFSGPRMVIFHPILALQHIFRPKNRSSSATMPKYVPDLSSGEGNKIDL